LLIKFTKESNDVEALSDHLNTIGSTLVSIEEALVNKPVIDVENDELTQKESSHLENLSFYWLQSQTVLILFSIINTIIMLATSKEVYCICILF